MSDFKAKMHQIRFRLGLCPIPRWGSSHRSPDPLAGFKGPTSEEREGRQTRGGRGREGEEKEEEGRGGREREKKGRGRREGKRCSPPNLQTKLRPCPLLLIIVFCFLSFQSCPSEGYIMAFVI